MDIFTLYRNYWNFAFDNPELIRPNHTAIYSFAIEHCNRLGWKAKFGLPTAMVMEATGIKSYNTYIKAFNDLVEFKLIILIERSKNQYSSNVVALSKNDKALNKALDKALTKHSTKQVESTQQSTSESIDSILIQINNKQITNIQANKLQESLNGFFANSGANKEKENTKENYKKLLLSKLESSDVENELYLKIAKSFQELFIKQSLEVGASAKKLKDAKGTWYDDVRMLIEIDKQTKDSISKVYSFLSGKKNPSSKFWQKNIQSTKSLRNQFERLLKEATENLNK